MKHTNHLVSHAWTRDGHEAAKLKDLRGTGPIVLERRIGNTDGVISLRTYAPVVDGKLPHYFAYDDGDEAERVMLAHHAELTRYVAKQP